MTNWYQRTKTADDMLDFRQIGRDIVKVVPPMALVMMVALYLGINQQKAETLLQNNPKSVQPVIDRFYMEHPEEATPQNTNSFKPSALPIILQDKVKPTQNTVQQPSQNIQKNIPQQQKSSGIISFEEIKDQLADHEGMRNKAYKDSLGYMTIGIGFNLDQNGARDIISNMGVDFDRLYSGQITLTNDQIEYLFELSYKNALQTATTFIPDLSSHPKNVQKVIIDMAFNLGNRLLNFVKLKQAINNRDYNLASQEMIQSKWYNQVGRRSKNLVNLIRQ